MASKQYYLVIPNPHEVLLIQGKAVSKFVHFLTVWKSKVVVREWSIKELFWTISQNCFCTMLWSLPTNPQAIFKAGLFCRSHGEREWKSLSNELAAAFYLLCKNSSLEEFCSNYFRNGWLFRLFAFIF